MIPKRRCLTFPAHVGCRQDVVEVLQASAHRGAARSGPENLSVTATDRQCGASRQVAEPNEGRRRRGRRFVRFAVLVVLVFLAVFLTILLDRVVQSPFRVCRLKVKRPAFRRALRQTESIKVSHPYA